VLLVLLIYHNENTIVVSVILLDAMALIFFLLLFQEKNVLRECNQVRFFLHRVFLLWVSCQQIELMQCIVKLSKEPRQVKL
jgi:hypothetical protein